MIATVRKQIKLTFDQKIQVAHLVGVWIAGIATVFVACVSLFLARKVRKVSLKTDVGIVMLIGNGYPKQEVLSISVTNIGECPVTVNSVGWTIGKRKNRRCAMQNLTHPNSDMYPIEINHGKTANFLVATNDDWKKDFVKYFVKDVSNGSLATLRANIYTSVGYSKDVVPNDDLLRKLKDTAKNFRSVYQ